MQQADALSLPQLHRFTLPQGHGLSLSQGDCLYRREGNGMARFLIGTAKVTLWRVLARPLHKMSLRCVCGMMGGSGCVSHRNAFRCVSMLSVSCDSRPWIGIAACLEQRSSWNFKSKGPDEEE